MSDAGDGWPAGTDGGLGVSHRQVPAVVAEPGPPGVPVDAIDCWGTWLARSSTGFNASAAAGGGARSAGDDATFRETHDLIAHEQNIRGPVPDASRNAPEVSRKAPRLGEHPGPLCKPPGALTPISLPLIGYASSPKPKRPLSTRWTTPHSSPATRQWQGHGQKTIACFPRLSACDLHPTE